MSSTFSSLGIDFWPFHLRQQLTALMISPNHIINPSTPSPLPGACVPATAGTHAELLVWTCTWIGQPGAVTEYIAPTQALGTPCRLYTSLEYWMSHSVACHSPKTLSTMRISLLLYYSIVNWWVFSSCAPTYCGWLNQPVPHHPLYCTYTGASV